MVDAALQRKNMVESQVRPSDVTDRRILRAMLDIPRETFVPEDLRSLAYMDTDVRLLAAAPGKAARAMLAPRVFARLLNLAALEEGDVVLDVGTGSGYSAAVLARIVRTVVALESDPGLAATAGKLLGAVPNVSVVTGGLAAGWPGSGPYDAIILEGAVSEVPQALCDQLRDGGRLVAVVGDNSQPRATLWQRLGSNFDQRAAFDAGASRLPGFGRKPAFSL